MAESDLLIETPWESRNLGLATFALNEASIDALDPTRLENAISGLRKTHQHAFVFARIDKAKLAMAPILQSCGFYLVECTLEPYIQFSRNRIFAQFQNSPEQFLPKRFDWTDICFEAAVPTPPAQRLFEIARESFSTDRFHMDYRCPPELANRRFELWVKDLLADRQVAFDLLKIRGQLVGFMARKEQQLILAGFSKDSQRSGLGDFLWLNSCSAVQASGYRSAETLISANNLPVLNLYSRLGFKFRNTGYSFHAWL